MTKIFIIISKITTLADIANDKSRLGLRTENSYIRLRPRNHTHDLTLFYLVKLNRARKSA